MMMLSLPCSFLCFCLSVSQTLHMLPGLEGEPSSHRHDSATYDYHRGSPVLYCPRALFTVLDPPPGLVLVFLFEKVFHGVPDSVIHRVYSGSDKDMELRYFVFQFLLFHFIHTFLYHAVLKNTTQLDWIFCILLFYYPFLLSIFCRQFLSFSMIRLKAREVTHTFGEYRQSFCWTSLPLISASSSRLEEKRNTERERRNKKKPKRCFSLFL